MSRICIPEQDVEEARAERYYFADHKVPTDQLVLYSADIATRPLNCWGSIVFPAIEFALYTHPKRIYIAGCDCSANGHIIWTQKKDFCSDKDVIIYGWKKIKQFQSYHYPDIEMISINPVGLKGLFKDVYTQTYVDKHPELSKENVEIINEGSIC